MSNIASVTVVLICIVGLWFGALWVVEGATRLARKVGISDLVVGLTVVAIGTSAPEFAVTGFASWSGQANISVGNVVGSNIFNLGFILGGVALVAGIPTSRKLVYRDGTVLIGATLLLAFFLADFQIILFEGLVLISCLVLYVGYLIYRQEETDEALSDKPFHRFDLARLIVGFVVILLSGHFFVEAATALARSFDVSEWVIGVTIVAIGTSAPEIATSLVAILRGQYDISAGNLIGSDLFNLLGVLGVAALINPLQIEPSAQSSIYVLVGMVVLVVVLMRTGWRLSRLEGGILVAINLVRWGFDFWG